LFPLRRFVRAKEDLRAAILAERGRRSASEGRALAQALRDVVLELPQLRAAERVAVYLSRAGEPGTGPLRLALLARGVDVVVPALGRSTRVSAVPEVDVLIVPALAVDTDGRRLGRGRDGYDRVLRRIDPRVLVLAVVHDDELLDSAVESLPEEPHDVRVPAVATPTRLRALAADAAPWPAAWPAS